MAGLPGLVEYYTDDESMATGAEGAGKVIELVHKHSFIEHIIDTLQQLKHCLLAYSIAYKR